MFARLAREISGVARMLGPWGCAVWMTGIVLRLPTILQSKSLAAADDFHGPVTQFRAFGKLLRVEPAPLGVCREVVGADCYRLCELSGGERNLVDLGANIGVATLAMAARCPEAHILAVEMDREAAAQFSRNITMNGISDRVTLKWARLGEAIHGGRGDGSAAPPCVVGDCLPDGVNYDFMKCDIEGAEHAVITPAATWLGRVRRIALEYHWTAEDGDSLAAILAQSGFDVTTAPHGSLGYVFGVRRRG
jgi:hypothetical protein